MPAGYGHGINDRHKDDDYTVTALNFPPESAHHAARRWIVAIALLALALRLLFVLVLDTTPDFSGGDVGWYMLKGEELVTTGKNAGPLPTAPLYLVFVGAVQALVPGDPAPGGIYTFAEMQTVRVIQAFVGAGLCVLIYALGRRLFGVRAARLAALVLAISPALIVEAGSPVTESFFLFFIFAGLAAYAAAEPEPSARRMAAVGALFGLAVLTRAVLLVFPAVFVVHLWLSHRPRWKPLAAALLVSYALTIGTWTAYNVIVWQRFVVGAEGLIGFLYQGASGQGSPFEIDASLGITPEDDTSVRHERQLDYLRDRVLGNLPGWIGHRVGELVSAYLQPHNTVHFGGESIKDATARWVRDDRTPGGLRAITQITAFWPKLLLYVFHYAGYALGLLGMIAWRRQWRALLPLYALVAYLTLVHLALLALPRYLFPTYPVVWLFGAAWVVRALRARTAISRQPSAISQKKAMGG